MKQSQKHHEADGESKSELDMHDSMGHDIDSIHPTSKSMDEKTDKPIHKIRESVIHKRRRSSEK